jgi:hypothetical protein
MIDLHGLYVREALEYADLAFELAALEDDSDKVVRFIVGTPFSSLLFGSETFSFFFRMRSRRI